MDYKILVLNPGSTSTKLAFYQGQECVLDKTVRHSSDELKGYKRIADQESFRRKVILETLEKEGFAVKDIDAISARGGLLKPIPGGTWEVNEKMVEDLKAGVQGEHASNLAGIIAFQMGEQLGCPAFIVDPVIVDEMDEIAKFSGMPEIERRSILHALNQKAVARDVAEEIGTHYEKANFIITHMGGGVSVGLHRKGKVVDVNNALDGEGPFSPERSGGLPVGDLVKLCFSEKYSQDFIKKRIKGQGGLVAYLGNNDLIQIEKDIENGDKKAEEVFEAMAYQIAKEIGSLAPANYGEIDAVILTGGMAKSPPLVKLIEERVKYIAPVIIKPGEKEMEALWKGALRVLQGREEPQIYS